MREILYNLTTRYSNSVYPPKIKRKRRSDWIEVPYSKLLLNSIFGKFGSQR